MNGSTCLTQLDETLIGPNTSRGCFRLGINHSPGRSLLFHDPDRPCVLHVLCSYLPNYSPAVNFTHVMNSYWDQL